MAALRALASLLPIVCAASAAGARYAWRTIALLPHPAAGYALDGRTLFTWGNGIAWRTLPDGEPHPLPTGARTFGEGGCLLDVDGDGRLDLVVNEVNPYALVWYRAPRWTRHTIDTGVDAPDMIAATVFGRRGVLLIHKRMQVRFYSVPPDPAQPWPARDIYSIYTPSWQGGLALADVDRDGRPDIFCGNYWIRAPGNFELPWRLFAINTWTEEEPSGTLRVAWNGVLGVAQRLLDAGRVAWFERPADPRQQWTAHDLGVFDHPNSLEAVDGGFLLAENGGAGRVLFFRPGSGLRELRRGEPVRFARSMPGGALLLAHRQGPRVRDAFALTSTGGRHTERARPAKLIANNGNERRDVSAFPLRSFLRASGEFSAFSPPPRLRGEVFDVRPCYCTDTVRSNCEGAPSTVRIRDVALPVRAASGTRARMR